MLSPRVVAGEQRAPSRADDELVAGVVAVAPEHRALHRGEDVAFEGARHREPVRLHQRRVGERRRPAHVPELGRALPDPQPGDQVGGVFEAAEAVQGGAQAARESAR